MTSSPDAMPSAVPAPPLWPVWLAIAVLVVSIGTLVARYVGVDVGNGDVRFWLGLLAIVTSAASPLAIRLKKISRDECRPRSCLTMLDHILLATYLRDRYLDFTIENPPLVTG